MSKKSKKAENPSIWAMDDLRDNPHEFKIWAGMEELDPPVFVGDGLNDAADAIEAARYAQTYTGCSILVTIDGHAMGVITPDGSWAPREWIRLENDSIEIYHDRRPWTHGRDEGRYAATDEEARAKAWRRYVDGDVRSPRITHEFLTGDEAKSILNANPCELRDASYPNGKGWIADMLCAVWYVYNEHGEVEDSEWEFANWEEKEPEAENEDED